MRSRPALLIVAALLATAPASAATPARHASPYVAELDRQCPGRDLQDMTAGDLEAIMEDFETGLSPAVRREIEAAVGQRCVRVEAGLSCANGAVLDVFRRRGLLKGFVRKVCATTWSCTRYRCVQAQP